MPTPTERVQALRWPLRTARLEMRLPGAADLGTLVRAVGDRRISDPTTIPYPYRAADGRQFVRNARAKHREGAGFDLLAFSREDGRLVGGFGLTLRGGGRPPPHAEAGYWVAVRDWGHGFASEMLAEGLRIGFRELRLHRIEAWVKGYNDASYRVLTKAGFREEGRARESVLHRRRYHDRILLGLLRPEYSGTRSSTRR